MSNISGDTQIIQPVELFVRRFPEWKGCVNRLIQRTENNIVSALRIMSLAGIAISSVGACFVYQGTQNRDILVTSIGSVVTLLGVGVVFCAWQLFSRSVENAEKISDRAIDQWIQSRKEAE